MEILTDMDDFDLYTSFSLKNEAHQNTIEDEGENKLPRLILSIFSLRTTSTLENKDIKPMSGSATVAVEKDDSGNTAVTAEVNVSSDDGTFEVSGSGSVNQDGDVSGKIEATINWQNDN